MTKSNEGKYTPGPWKVWASSGRDIEDSEGNLLATAYPDEKDPSYTSEQAKANAHLISSAPELLEALIKCRVALTPHVFIDDDAKEARNTADKAIALAEGRV